MIDFIKLLRPKDWAKNTFLFIPLFFSGSVFDINKIIHLLIGFLAFSFVASCVYIINDYRDIEDDKKHPKKSKRPLASGAVSKQAAIVILILLLITGFTLSYFADTSFKFMGVLGFYFLMNLFYSFGGKNISILDIMIVAAGFVLRVKAGGLIAGVSLSLWLNLMVFLLSLFMAIAKRRDDILLKMETGVDMRKSIKGYNIDFLNTLLGLFSAIIIVTYIMYCASPFTIEKLGTYQLYYTTVFVIAGLMRYLQITLVQNKAGSPTEILYKDRFIQITLILWIASFYAIIYLKGLSFLRVA
jgi:decaprenyl-phosphate phosphoribosyltransferase